MARYIDADKFMERLKDSPAFSNMGMDGYFLLDVVEELLKKFPAADVVPKSEGEWETVPDHLACSNYRHRCIECDYFYKDKKPYGHKYCPNCGAHMRKEDEGK